MWRFWVLFCLGIMISAILYLKDINNTIPKSENQIILYKLQNMENLKPDSGAN